MELHSMILLFILITDSASAATDTIFPNQTLKDGDTIVSAAETFELGFFSFRNSPFRYLGIWYKKISPLTVVWVANRDVRLLDASSMLKLNNDGNLQLLSVSNTLVWSSLSSNLATNSSPVAQLLDSGNLVIRDDISNGLVWQSFDNPGDTWLPGMKIGVERVKGVNWNLTSWKTNDDPSFGSYTVWMNINGYPQLYNTKDESSLQQRIGYWNGLGFSGVFVRTRMILNPEGNFVQLIWNDSTQKWLLYSSPLNDECDLYGVCGPYGICSINNSPPCACSEGFEPKLPEEWSVADWVNGCKRRIHLNPLEECKSLCANHDLCTAFASSDISVGGSGCLMWFGELMDIREAPQGDVSGQDIIIQLE